MVATPETAPVLVGVKATVTVQLVCPAKEAPHVPPVIAKSALTAMERGKAEAVLLVSVNV